MALTKVHLAHHLYVNHVDLTKDQAHEAVEAILRISKDSLISGSDLLLSGFGKYSVKEKKSRRGRNPVTGKDLMLEGRKVVTFKASGILRAKLNEPG